jgi:hypothetical protein
MISFRCSTELRNRPTRYKLDDKSCEYCISDNNQCRECPEVTGVAEQGLDETKGCRVKVGSHVWET